MSTALVASGVITHTREQLDLIKRTYAVGTTDDEFQLFIATTQRLGLDIYAKQAYCVPRWNKQAGRTVMQTQVSIDGFRVVAERTGKYEGQTSPMWCGDDGVWRDVWTSKDAPTAARVGVYRNGHREACYGVALFSEFCQMTRDGKPSGQWASMPCVMLLKCAESQALRKAFPNDLSGIYSEEEMMQSENGSHLREATEREGAIAEEQAKRRMEAEALADEWIPMVEGYTTIKDLESFIYYQGSQIRTLHSNAKAKLWRRIQATCERLGMSPNDAKKLIKEAPEITDAEEVTDE